MESLLCENKLPPPCAVSHCACVCDGGLFLQEEGAAGSQSTGSDQPPTNKHCLHIITNKKVSVITLLEVDLRVCVHVQVTRAYACFYHPLSQSYM